MLSESVMLRLRSVAQSDLLRFSSRRILEWASSFARVRMIPVRDEKWIRPVAAYYRGEAYLSPVVRRLIEILKAKAKAKEIGARKA